MTRSIMARWSLAGLSAGLMLTAAMLVIRLWRGVPSLPEQIQDQLLLLVPGRVFSFALQRLEYTAKPLLFTSVIAAIVVIGGVAGLLFGLARQRVGQRVDLARPLPSIATGLALWLLVTLGVLPMLGVATLLTDAQTSRIDAAAMLLIPGAAFGLTLGLVGGALIVNPATPAP